MLSSHLFHFPLSSIFWPQFFTTCYHLDIFKQMFFILCWACLAVLSESCGSNCLFYHCQPQKSFSTMIWGSLYVTGSTCKSFCVCLVGRLGVFLFIYLFLAALGLLRCARAFSSCSERGLLFVVVRGPLITVASLVAEHGLQARGLQ